MRNSTVIGNKKSLLTHAAWSPGDDLIIACYGGEAPRLLATRTKQILRDLRLEEEADNSQFNYIADWSPDGSRIALGHGSSIHILDANGHPLNKFKVSMPVPSLADCLKYFANDPVISRLQPKGSTQETKDKLQEYFRSVKQVVSTLRWDYTGKFVAVGTPIGAYALDPDTGGKVLFLGAKPCPSKIETPVFSRDGLSLAAIYVPDTDAVSELYWNFNRSLNVARPVLCVWTLASGSVTIKYQGSELPQGDNDNFKLYWSPDSRRLAWTSDNNVMTFDLEKQLTKVLQKTQNSQIEHLAWDPTGQKIAFLDRQDGVVLIDSLSGVRLANYREALWGRFQDIGERTFAWSNRGDAMVIGSSQYAIDMWRMTNLPI